MTDNFQALRERMARLLLCFGIFAACSLRAWAQVDVGTAIGPEAWMYGDDTAKHVPKVTMTPLALATSLALDATTWTALNASTATTPAKEIFHLQQRGFYNLEIYQMMILAQRSGSTLRKLSEQRDKGVSMRDIAKGLKLDFDPIYDESLVLEKKIEKQLLPRVLTVSVLPPSSGGYSGKP